MRGMPLDDRNQLLAVIQELSILSSYQMSSTGKTSATHGFIRILNKVAALVIGKKNRICMVCMFVGGLFHDSLKNWFHVNGK